MDARLEAAQRGLIWLLVASVAALLICLPRPGDARVAHGFEELRELERTVDLASVERTRRSQAMQFAQVALDELLLARDAEPARPSKRERAATARAPKWSVAEGAAPVLSLASLRLATLQDISAQSQGATTADVGVPQAEAARSALAFRLARTQLTGPLALKGAVIEAAELSMREVELQQEAAGMRAEVGEAQAQLDRAEHRVELANKRVDARKKRRSRSTQKFLEQLASANEQRDEKAAAFQTLQARYEGLAQQAVQASEDAPLRVANNEIPDVARLRITLADAQGKDYAIAVAVPLTQRKVSLPPLVIPGIEATLPALRATEAWEELKSLAPTPALANMAGRLSWQSRRTSILGFAVEGAWLLQIVPCLVALVLFLAARRATNAASSYRLFSTEVRGSMRPVGFQKRVHELLVVVLLPLAACLLSIASLLLLHRPPVFPALAFMFGLPFALRLFGKLDELRVLKRSIIQYHSYPPPAAAPGVEGGFEPKAV